MLWYDAGMPDAIFRFISPFPWYLDLTALVLGTIGFLMAIQPFTQVIFGRPKVRAHLFAGTFEELQVIECLLANDPTMSWFPRWLRVHRDVAEDVHASFHIQPHNKEDALFTEIPMINTFDGVTAQRVRLPASVLPSKFMIVFTGENGQVFAVNNNKQTVSSPTGLYDVNVEINVDGVKKTFSKQIVVQDSNPYAYLVD